MTASVEFLDRVIESTCRLPGVQGRQITPKPGAIGPCLQHLDPLLSRRGDTAEVKHYVNYT